MDVLEKGFVEFQNLNAADIKRISSSEMIDRLIKEGKAKVDVLDTKDTWFGVTYQEDKEVRSLWQTCKRGRLSGHFINKQFRCVGTMDFKEELLWENIFGTDGFAEANAAAYSRRA